MIGFLSKTAERRAADESRQAKERDRDVWATAEAHWERELASRRQIFDEVSVETAEAFAAMMADNAEHPENPADARDPLASSAQRRWLVYMAELEKAQSDATRVEGLLGLSRQRRAQLDIQLGDGEVA